MDRMKNILKDWVLPFGLEILAVLIIVKFVCFLAVVPTGSMLPTISEHSLLFATHLYQPEKNVERGDILVFQSDELDKTLIKRCIGLPGDHIVLDENGLLFVNGVYTPEPYVIHTEARSGEFTVPEACYLFMGDNRGGSADARYWENPYIPADKLMGKARFTLWPFSNFGVLQ